MYISQRIDFDIVCVSVESWDAIAQNERQHLNKMWWNWWRATGNSDTVFLILGFAFNTNTIHIVAVIWILCTDCAHWYTIEFFVILSFSSMNDLHLLGCHQLFHAQRLVGSIAGKYNFQTE